MPYPKKYSGRYDTPTDGISKKVFDRYKDKQVQKYVKMAEDIRALQRIIRQNRASGEEE